MDIGAQKRSPRCLMDADACCGFIESDGYVDRSGLVGAVSVSRCASCGMGVTLPPLADVAFLYANRTSHDFQPGTRGLSLAIKRLAFALQARALLKQVGATPRTVADFACGSGLFTTCLAESLPPGTRVVASDFQADPPPDLRRVEYRSIEHLGDLAGQADLVLAMHVVEHDDDPRALLERISRLAKPGGYVVIEVPHIDCVWTGVFGRQWDAWYLPYHRTHFSRASLRALVESDGLSIQREIDVSLPTMGRTFANLLRRRNGLPFILLGAALHPIQWALEWLTRRPAALRIIAQKPL